MLTNTTEIGTARMPLRRVTIPALTAVPPSATRLTIISVDEHPASIRSSAAAGSVPPAEVEARYSEQAGGGARRTARSRVYRKRPFAIHAAKRLVLDECNRMTRVCYVT